MVTTYRGVHIESVHYDRRADRYELYSTDGEIVAELKRVEFLSQPQLRTLRQTNGRYRKAYSQVHSRPARKSNITIDWRAINSALWGAVVSFDPAEPEPPIEHAGIRAGEVMGRRAWRVEDDRLFSVYIKWTEWMPGECLRGRSKDTRSEGVHAFKDIAHVQKYIDIKRREVLLWSPFGDGELVFNDDGTISFVARPPEIFVIGTVALWGEIVEHERGYRAEFAKIASLDSVDAIGAIDKRAVLDRLRARYRIVASASSGTPSRQ